MQWYTGRFISYNLRIRPILPYGHFLYWSENFIAYTETQNNDCLDSILQAWEIPFPAIWGVAIFQKFLIL